MTSTILRTDMAGIPTGQSGRNAVLVCAGFLGLVFLMGGGSRADIASLSVLRPMAAFVLVLAAVQLDWQQWRQWRLELLVLAGAMALVFLQLLPLPPGAWQALPGRELIRSIDLAAGLGDIWRPVSMDPVATRNAFWALTVPMAMLVLLMRAGRENLTKLLPIVLIIGAINGLVSLLQVLGDRQGPLYLYAVTNHGEAVGLFANRNHNAAFFASLFPLLGAWWAREGQGPNKQAGNPQGRTGRQARLARGLVALASGLFLLVLVLVTGSRSGSLLALVSIAATLALVVAPVTSRQGKTARAAFSGGSRAEAGMPGRRLVVALAGVGAFATAGLALTIALGRAKAIERLFDSDPASEMRLKILPTVDGMLGQYWPWGTGTGTFASVFRIHEPDSLLSTTYRNQAHNDWLDLLLTGGIAAVFLLGLVMASFAWRLWRGHGSQAGFESRIMVRAASIGIMVFALASVTDYPLRVPSLACLFVVLLAWTAVPHQPGQHEAGQRR